MRRRLRKGSSRSFHGQFFFFAFLFCFFSAFSFCFLTVSFIDAWASSQKAVASVVGNDNSMVNVLMGEGKGVCAVTCELMVDGRALSGYAWSNEKGRTVTLSAPQMCSVRIVTERVPPITKLFAKLKDIWENK